MSSPIPTSEVIDIAYIPYLISDNIIDLDEFFNYLIESGPTDNALIAFRSLVITSEGTILRDAAIHKLHSDFIVIAQMTEYSSIMYDVTDDLSLQRCIHCSNAMKKPIEFFRTLRLLEISGMLATEDTELSDTIRAYHLKHVSNVDEAILAISVDRLNIIVSHDSSYISSVLDRVKYLSSSHKRYWEVYARKAHSQFIERFLSAPLTVMANNHIEYDVIKELSSYLDLPEKTSQMISSELKYNILVKYRGLERYALGCHDITPSPELLEGMITSLEELGIDEYCNLHSDKTRQRYESKGYEIMNDKNVSMESIWDYSPADIVGHVKDGKMWLFTRDEFKSLKNSGVNHYTKVQLDDSILSTITSVSKFFNSKGLKSCHTIREMLEGKIEISGGSSRSTGNPISDLLQIILNQE